MITIWGVGQVGLLLPWKGAWVYVHAVVGLDEDVEAEAELRGV